MLRMPVRALSQCGSIVAMAAVIAGCGAPAAAPGDIEGTVQARVSATVRASTRAQASPTSQPGSTVIAIPPASTAPPTSAQLPTAVAIGTAAAVATAAAGVDSVPQATRPPAATATLGVARPAASAVPNVPATLTAPVPLRLGTHVRLGGFWVTVARYEWGYTCPSDTSGGGRPSPGTKFVTLRIAGRNDSGAVLALPPVHWTLEGHQAGSGAQMPCRPDDQALANTCYRTGQLAPGARCEGWLLFAVPEAMAVPGAVVQASTTAAGSPDIARWRLPA